MFVGAGPVEVAVPEPVALDVWLPTSKLIVSEEVEVSEELPLDAVGMADMDAEGTVVVVVTDS